jgi:hypothetical protein
MGPWISNHGLHFIPEDGFIVHSVSPGGVFACKSSQSSPSFFLELQVEREQINSFHGPVLNSRTEATLVEDFYILLPSS